MQMLSLNDATAPKQPHIPKSWENPGFHPISSITTTSGAQKRARGQRVLQVPWKIQAPEQEKQLRHWWDVPGSIPSSMYPKAPSIGTGGVPRALTRMLTLKPNDDCYYCSEAASLNPSDQRPQLHYSHSCTSGRGRWLRTSLPRSPFSVRIPPKFLLQDKCHPKTGRESPCWCCRSGSLWHQLQLWPPRRSKSSNALTR